MSKKLPPNHHRMPAQSLDGCDAAYGWLLGTLVYDPFHDRLILRGTCGCDAVNLQPSDVEPICGPQKTRPRD